MLSMLCWQSLILGLGFFSGIHGNLLLLIYVVLPSYDYLNRYKAMQFMVDLMDQGVPLRLGDGREPTEARPAALLTTRFYHTYITK